MRPPPAPPPESLSLPTPPDPPDPQDRSSSDDSHAQPLILLHTTSPNRVRSSDVPSPPLLFFVGTLLRCPLPCVVRVV
ncbi:hypothetical protein CARUB_v10006157mg [Capsella rubella]|uniref:Uncharacterized protein n=1 Tax=Capsella rubella TaxID=81985 RepID=R0H2N2_9BRAS|nr:hypothetical protein CARUB_v10006157mg [Capsella rubella]